MLWGGRFKKKLNSSAFEFSTSLPFDINLIEEDLQVSKVHVEMLAKVNLISENDSKKIISGLELIKSEWQNGKWIPDISKFEDIHSAIESRLYKLIGTIAGKLHTGRSRNDLVATDFKLWIKKACKTTYVKIEALQKVLIDIAEKHTTTLIPGYTHLQQAQPISFAFHLLAYVEMLERDKKRISFVLEECNSCPLGSGALAGSTLPLDREFTSEKLDFEEPSSNALDSVSDRDFALDFLNACSIGMMHLSRLSEELILWSTTEWNFIQIGDEYTTGSSLMPQKKNPDMAELTRGKTGRVYGNYVNLISNLKSLPLSYNRDLQEDKEPVFDSMFQYSICLDIIKGIINSIKVNTERYRLNSMSDFILATDLADWLVLKNIHFREAHNIVGKVVKYAERKNKSMKELSINELKNIHEAFDGSVYEVLDISKSLNRKVTYGSPNPKLVDKQIKNWKGKL
jgi:argininosuccinate lyase